MPKKKSRKASTSMPIEKAQKDANRYLTVFLEKGRSRGDFFVTDSLEAAKENTPPKSVAKKPTKPLSTSPFWQLQKKIIDRIAVHRSLDHLMVLLHTLNMEIQFQFRLKPTLDDLAKLELEKRIARYTHLIALTREKLYLRSDSPNPAPKAFKNSPGFC